MAKEYIERKLAKAEFTGNFQDAYPTAQIHALLDAIPTADVVEVVRCKNCMYCAPYGDFFVQCHQYNRDVDSLDAYCSRGKRRGKACV